MGKALLRDFVLEIMYLQLFDFVLSIISYSLAVSILSSWSLSIFTLKSLNLFDF